MYKRAVARIASQQARRRQTQQANSASSEAPPASVPVVPQTTPASEAPSDTVPVVPQSTPTSSIPLAPDMGYVHGLSVALTNDPALTSTSMMNATEIQ